MKNLPRKATIALVAAATISATGLVGYLYRSQQEPSYDLRLGFQMDTLLRIAVSCERGVHHHLCDRLKQLEDKDQLILQREDLSQTFPDGALTALRVTVVDRCNSDGRAIVIDVAGPTEVFDGVTTWKPVWIGQCKEQSSH